MEHLLGMLSNVERKGWMFASIVCLLLKPTKEEPTVEGWANNVLKQRKFSP